MNTSDHAPSTPGHFPFTDHGTDHHQPRTDRVTDQSPTTNQETPGQSTDHGTNHTDHEHRPRHPPPLGGVRASPAGSEVTCPVCHAEPGHGCITAMGQTMPHLTHGGRRRKARAALTKDPDHAA